MHAGGRRFSVLTSGDFKSLTEIENTVITAIDDQPIYLRNIASVVLREGLPSYRGFYQGQASVFLSVIQRGGSNIFNVSDQVKETLETFKQELADDTQLHIINDQSISVESRVNGFFVNLLQGLLLVAVACVLVLGRGPSFVVVMAIPVSIFIAIG